MLQAKQAFQKSDYSTLPTPVLLQILSKFEIMYKIKKRWEWKNEVDLTGWVTWK